MKSRIIYLLLIIGNYSVYSQQDAQYTQYMYNTISINPAYAGSRDMLSVFGLYRTQWIGLDGAPKTGSFSVNTPIKGSNLGVGLSFVNDRIGPTDENKIAADVSYTISTSNRYKLSFGLKGTVDLFDFNASKTKSYSTTDVTYQNINNDFSPNIGAGVYFHSDKLYFGVSVPSILEAKRYSDNDVAVYKERMNTYIIGGYVFDLTSSIRFKPAFLTKAIQGSPLQLDISGNFMFNEKLILGAAWRWDAAMSAMAGFQISDKIFIGYGYDRETTKLKNYNSGSHEIFLCFELFKRENKIASARFF